VLDEETTFKTYTEAATQALIAKQDAALAGKLGGILYVAAKQDGAKINELKMQAPPVWDGLVAAQGRLYLANTRGEVVCLAPRE